MPTHHHAHKENDDPPPPNSDVMLQTAVRLGLTDIPGVHDYLIETEDAKMAHFREERAKFLAEKHKKEKEAEEETIRSFGGLGGPLKKTPRAIWEENPDIPMTADFLKDLSFAEMAKTPQGVRMTMACLLHYDAVRRNAKLRARLQEYMKEKLEEIHANIYGPIVPLLTVSLIIARRESFKLNSNGEPKTLMVPMSIFGPDEEQFFEAIPIKARTYCCGHCGSKIPNGYNLTATDKQKTFVMKITCSHWNGELPEWIDVLMPEDTPFVTIHSATQMHTGVENNYDIFDPEGRVLGVASPEKAPSSDIINVTLYDKDGAAVSPRIKHTNYKYGEYALEAPLEMTTNLKAVGTALMIFLLVEDLAGYEGRGKHGR